MMLLSRALILFTVLFLPSMGFADQRELVFTAIPDQDESQLQQRFSKVAAYLEQELGVKVRYLPVKSYGAAVTAFSHDQVQLAWFGGLSGVRARMRVKGSEAIAQGYEDQFFKTYFIANVEQTQLKGSVKNLDALEGFTFTFGSKGSTSGRLMPEFYLREQFGVVPNKVFTRVGYSGDHSRTIALVESGAFNTGAVNFKVWDQAVAAGKVDTSKVAVVWQTPGYPDYQWSIRGDVEQRFGVGFKEKVREALLTMRSPALLAAFPRQSFVAASNEDYAPIVDVAKRVGLID
ncbi:putative selenate ABC transporter substrate-binding protein [Gammaproteobacteria bacterium 45_16_T64]|nr:putative selenate ABC transporter substrate-binding protein [Gammaproteobacteria bacterium 45_16_T64]